MESIGTRLKKSRERKGYTQQSIAKKLGVTNGAISGYERDYRDPDTDILTQMAELYEVSIDYLLGRTNSPEAVISEPSRALVDSFNVELTDEEIMEKIKFTVEGQELPDQMIKDFLSYARVELAKRNQK